jgi:hypothetical protein
MSAVLKNVVVFAPVVSTISGTVATEAAASGPAFTGGAVRYINPEALRPFNTQRGRLDRTCRAMGVRFLSGWAVPEEAAAKLQEQLAPLVDDTQVAINKFLVDYDALAAQWQQEHPEVAPFAGRFPSRSQVAARMSVAVSIFKIDNGVAGADQAQNGLLSELGALPRRALEEIAQDVRHAWDPSKGVAGQRTLGVVHRVCEKLRTLEFLGGNLGQAARLIEATLQRLPSKGKIEGVDYAVLASLFGALEKPDFLVSISSNLPEVGDFDPLGALGVSFQPVSEVKEVSEAAETVSAEAVSAEAVSSGDDEDSAEAVNSGDDDDDEVSLPPASQIAISQPSPDGADAWSW